MIILNTNIKSLSMGDLAVFAAIYEHQSITAAARQLGRPQPSVSNILRDLRGRVGDPLFIRRGRKMQPTAQADILAPYVRDALATLSLGFEQSRTFDPQHHERRFTLSITDIAEAVLLPTLLAGLSEKAPHFSFDCVRGHTADIAIGYLPRLGPNWTSRTLFETDYVALLGPDHPRYKAKSLNASDYDASRHAIATMPGTGHAALAALIHERSGRANISANLPSFLALPDIAAGTDAIATVPRPLGVLACQRLELTMHLLPIPIDPIVVRFHTRQTKGPDPALEWLSEQCAAIFSQDVLPAVLRRNDAFA